MNPFSFEEFLQKVFGAAVYVGINCVVLLAVAVIPMLSLNFGGYLPRHYHAQRVGDYYVVNRLFLANHDYTIYSDEEAVYAELFGYSCKKSFILDKQGSYPEVGKSALGRCFFTSIVNAAYTDMVVDWSRNFSIIKDADNWLAGLVPSYLQTSIISPDPFEVVLVREHLSPLVYLVYALYGLFWLGMFVIVNASVAYRMWIQSKTPNKQEK